MKAMRQIVAVLALVMLARSAQAQVLSLTPDGVSRGFTLTTIASNFPGAPIPFSSSGPFGLLYSTSGLLVTDGTDSSVRLFKKDCDGQDASTNRPTAFYAVGQGGPVGITEAHLHGKPKYYLITAPGEVFQINADGTPIEKVVTIPGNFAFVQIAADPHFGVLLATAAFCGDIDFSCGGIFSIDPVAKTSTEIAPNFSVTALQVDSSDNIFINFFFFGTIWFNPDFSIKSIFPLPEAEGFVLGTGTLADHIFLLDHTGEVWEQNLDGSDLTMIASGSGGNPIATADPHNGSLVFTYGDNKVVRLSGGGLASADGETQVNSCMDK